MMVKKIFFYYCFIFALFLFISGIATSKTTNQLLMQVIFFPVPAYFLFTLLSQIKRKEPSHPLNVRKKTTLIFILLFFLLVAGSIVQITKTYPEKKVTMLPPITHIPSPTALPEKPTHVVVKTDEEYAKVNIREEASTSAKILQKASNGQKFPVKEVQKEWYKIVLDNGSFGYIHKKFTETE